METSKTIILPEEKKESNKESNKDKKQIEKQVLKRQITKTPKWKFSQEDLTPQQQIFHLNDPIKQSFLYQQIKNKLHSYKSQDIEKNLFQMDLQMDLSGVLHKLETSQYKCFYCKQIILLLYDNVRDPRQWTLERLDNKKGHIFDNVEIACLSCNLRRRTMKVERYVLTQEIKIVKKIN
jgi:hypothetical protein